MANGLPLGDPAVTGEDLRSLRDRIDAIDEDIVRLLVQRAAVVQQVGHVKQQSGAPVFRPEREVSILERLCAANRAQGGDGSRIKRGGFGSTGKGGDMRQSVIPCRHLTPNLPQMAAAGIVRADVI